MALTWAGVITILFLAAACVRGYRRGLIKELVSLVCVFLSMAIVWFINPYVNEFIRENTSIYEKVQESCREFRAVRRAGRVVLRRAECPHDGYGCRDGQRS